jgi:hypothetical protein
MEVSGMKEPVAYIILNGIDGDLLDFLNLIDGYIEDMPDDYLMISSIHGDIKISVYFTETGKQYEGAEALRQIIIFRQKQLDIQKYINLKKQQLDSK